MYGDRRIQLYDAELALKGSPDRESIYVELLKHAPSFPNFPDMGCAAKSFKVNYDFSSPHADEIVWDMISGTPSRLVGMHVDEHDNYYRLRRQDGSDIFASMTFKLALLRGECPAEEYAAVDHELTEGGAGPVGEFLVTREIDSVLEYVEPYRTSVIIRFFTKDDYLIFGPFEEEADYDAFNERLSAFGDFSRQNRWLEKIKDHPRFCGHELPEGIAVRHTENIDGEGFIETLFVNIEDLES
ncbi:hypothetical protein [Salipiger sp. CCB-MM3]|uniref:hypothetical protein n=1 Tax=Salipiger sp. CCB-MM3 TaxID=1792508 RepID=UPI0012FC6B0F|nr:hypothetical protein [Salipiger sp. CCB-MM3]